MFNFDPFFAAPMAELLRRFFSGSLLHPFDTRSFVEDDIQSLAVDVFEDNGRMVVDATLPAPAWEICCAASSSIVCRKMP